jgi:hypothetical protein
MKVHLHAPLILALDGPEWSASCPGCYTSKAYKPNTNQIGGWAGSETNPDVLKNRKISCRPSNRRTIPCLTSPLPSLNTDSAIGSEPKAFATEKNVRLV